MSSIATAADTAIRARILLVDDEPAVCAGTARILERRGYDVTTAADGRSALALIAKIPFDVIVSDVSMPELDGITLLRVIRQRDLDVPVILMTGAPTLALAIQAIAHGALNFLIKPVLSSELNEAVRRGVSLHRLARMKREALLLVSEGGLGVADGIGLAASFKRALDSLSMAFQPIVSAVDHTTFGYEGLMRSAESSLPHPGALLAAAERLTELPELGRKVRSLTAAAIPSAPAHALLFVNLHVRDLLDLELFSDTSPLSSFASRVVLEISERATLDDIPGAREKVLELRHLGYRIAIDDLGTGYAGLTSFVTLAPDFVKIDLSLVRSVGQASGKQKLIRRITTQCKDLGMTVVAEGVETAEERDALTELGCDLLQGYLFARPSPEFQQSAT